MHKNKILFTKSVILYTLPFNSKNKNNTQPIALSSIQRLVAVALLFVFANIPFTIFALRINKKKQKKVPKAQRATGIF